MNAPPESFGSGGLRPNTIPPHTFMSLTDEQVRAMSDADIRSFLDYYLGIRLPVETPRTVLLSKLDSVAVAARSY